MRKYTFRYKNFSQVEKALSYDFVIVVEAGDLTNAKDRALLCVKDFIKSEGAESLEIERIEDL